MPLVCYKAQQRSGVPVSQLVGFWFQEGGERKNIERTKKIIWSCSCLIIIKVGFSFFLFFSHCMSRDNNLLEQVQCWKNQNKLMKCKIWGKISMPIFFFLFFIILFYFFVLLIKWVFFFKSSFYWTWIYWFINYTIKVS